MKFTCADGANCAIPDCDFKATSGSDRCWCHTRGFNPPLSFSQYEVLDDAGVSAYRAFVRLLARIHGATS